MDQFKLTSLAASGECGLAPPKDRSEAFGHD